MTSATAGQPGRVEYLNPAGLVSSPAFTNVVVVSGLVRTVYVGGQDAVNADGEIVGRGDLGAQTGQILANLETALAAAGATLGHVVKWNVYVVEGQDVAPAFAAFRRVWGDRPNPPLITGVFVSHLARPEFLAEMDAIAVVPIAEP